MYPFYIIIELPWLTSFVQYFVEDPRFETYLRHINIHDMIAYILSPAFKEADNDVLDIIILNWVIEKFDDDLVYDTYRLEIVQDLTIEIVERLFDRLYGTLYDSTVSTHVEKCLECYCYRMWLDINTIVLVQYLTP